MNHFFRKKSRNTFLQLHLQKNYVKHFENLPLHLSEKFIDYRYRPWLFEIIVIALIQKGLSCQSLNTIIKVIGLTRLGIKHESTAPEANACTTQASELLNSHSESVLCWPSIYHRSMIAVTLRNLFKSFVFSLFLQDCLFLIISLLHVFQGSAAALAKAVLAEVPAQVVKYFKSRNMIPGKSPQPAK